LQNASKQTEFLPFLGGWTNNAANPLDAPREHHVQEIHDGERHLELWSGALGDFHLRKTALVSAVQQ